MQWMAEGRAAQDIADQPRLHGPPDCLRQGRSHSVQAVKVFYGMNCGTQWIHDELLHQAVRTAAMIKLGRIRGSGHGRPLHHSFPSRGRR